MYLFLLVLKYRYGEGTGSRAGISIFVNSRYLQGKTLLTTFSSSCDWSVKRGRTATGANAKYKSQFHSATDNTVTCRRKHKTKAGPQRCLCFLRHCTMWSKDKWRDGTNGSEKWPPAGALVHRCGSSQQVRWGRKQTYLCRKHSHGRFLQQMNVWLLRPFFSLSKNT